MTFQQTRKLSWTGLVCCCLLAPAGCATSKTKVTDSSTPGKYSSESPASKAANAKGSPKINLAYARLQEQQGELAGARTSYERVLAENPKSVEAMIGLAHLDQMAGRPEVAETRLKEANRLEPKNPATLAALGRFYSEEKKWPQAIYAFNQALGSAPDDKTTRFHLACAFARSGNIEQSMPHFIQSVGTAAAHYNIGVIEYERGHLKASEEHLVMAAMSDPKMEQVQYYLDEIQKANGTRPALASSGAANSRPAVAGYQAPMADRRNTAVNSAPVNNAAVHSGAVNTPEPYLGNGPQITAGSSGSTYNAQGFTRMPQNMSAAQQAQPAADPNAAGAQGSATGLTPQQWEQWNNQRTGR